MEKEFISKKEEKTVINYTALDNKYSKDEGYKVDIIVVEDPEENNPKIIAEIEYK